MIVRTPATFAALHQLTQDIEGPVDDISFVLQDSTGVCFPWREYKEVYAIQAVRESMTTESLLNMVRFFADKGREAKIADHHMEALEHFAMRNAYQDLHEKFEWPENRPHARGMVMDLLRISAESLQPDPVCIPMMALYHEAIHCFEREDG